MNNSPQLLFSSPDRAPDTETFRSRDRTSSSGFKTPNETVNNNINKRTKNTNNNANKNATTYLPAAQVLSLDSPEASTPPSASSPEDAAQRHLSPHPLENQESHGITAFTVPQASASAFQASPTSSPPRATETVTHYKKPTPSLSRLSSHANTSRTASASAVGGAAAAVSRDSSPKECNVSSDIKEAFEGVPAPRVSTGGEAPIYLTPPGSVSSSTPSHNVLNSFERLIGTQVVRSSNTNNNNSSQRLSSRNMSRDPSPNSLAHRNGPFPTSPPSSFSRGPNSLNANIRASFSLSRMEPGSTARRVAASRVRLEEAALVQSISRTAFAVGDTEMHPHHPTASPATTSGGYTLADYARDKKVPTEVDHDLEKNLYFYLVLLILVPFCLIVLLFGVHFWGCKLMLQGTGIEKNIGVMKKSNFTLMIGILVSFVGLVVVCGLFGFFCLRYWFGLRRYAEGFRFAAIAASHLKRLEKVPDWQLEEYTKLLSPINLGCMDAHYTIYYLFYYAREAGAVAEYCRQYIPKYMLQRFMDSLEAGDGLQQSHSRSGRDTSPVPTVNAGSQLTAASPSPLAADTLHLSNESSATTMANTVRTGSGIPALNLNSRSDTLTTTAATNPNTTVTANILEVPASQQEVLVSSPLEKQLSSSFAKMKQRMKGTTSVPALRAHPSFSCTVNVDEDPFMSTAVRYGKRGAATMNLEASISQFFGAEASVVRGGDGALGFADTGVFSRSDQEVGPLVTFLVCKLFLPSNLFRSDGSVGKDTAKLIEELSSCFHEGVSAVATRTEGSVYDVMLDSVTILYNVFTPVVISNVFDVVLEGELEIATYLFNLQESYAKKGVHFRWSTNMHQSRMIEFSIREPHSHVLLASPEVDFAAEIADLSQIINCPTLSLQSLHFGADYLTTVPIDIIWGGYENYVFVYKVKETQSSPREETEIGQALADGLRQLFLLDFDKAVEILTVAKTKEMSANYLYHLSEVLQNRKRRQARLGLEMEDHYCRLKPEWRFPEQDCETLDYTLYQFKAPEKPPTPLVPNLALGRIGRERSASATSTAAPLTATYASPRFIEGEEEPVTPKRPAQRRRRSSTLLSNSSGPALPFERLRFQQRAAGAAESIKSPPEVSFTNQSIHTNEQLFSDDDPSRLSKNVTMEFGDMQGMDGLPMHARVNSVDTSGAVTETDQGEFCSPNRSRASIHSFGLSRRVSTARNSVILDTSALRTTTSAVILRQSPSGASQSTSSASFARGGSRAQTNHLIFTLGDCIGSGTGGREVFQGLDDRGRIVAIKQIPIEGNAKEVEDAHHEIETLSRLKHENIVRYIASSVDKDYLYIVMEYVSGGTLNDLIQTFGPLPFDVVRRYFTGMLRGLRYLHSQNIIHRDISLNNVLVSTEGIPRLLDFGGAVGTVTHHNAFPQDLVDCMTDMGAAASVQGTAGKKVAEPVRGMIFGTPLYMSPQACQGIVDARNDIWSVGILLCQCISGTPPWNEADTQDRTSFLQRLAAGELLPIIPYDLVPPNLARFIEKCLNPILEKRPTAAELLMEPFIIK